MSGQPARWGFHQLTDAHARRLVAAAGVKPGETVVDLGAGNGVITAHLLDAGARVIAIELHPGRVAVLRARFAACNVRVITVDVSVWQPPARPFRVVANPPFAVLATMLRRLTALRSGLVSADLVVPTQVAARWARGGGLHPDRYHARLLRHLPAFAFMPPATQPTSVMRVQRHPRR